MIDVDNPWFKSQRAKIRCAFSKAEKIWDEKGMDGVYPPFSDEADEKAYREACNRWEKLVVEYIRGLEVDFTWAGVPVVYESDGKPAEMWHSLKTRDVVSWLAQEGYYGSYTTPDYEEDY